MTHQGTRCLCDTVMAFAFFLKEKKIMSSHGEKHTQVSPPVEPENIPSEISAQSRKFEHNKHIQGLKVYLTLDIC